MIKRAAIGVASLALGLIGCSDGAGNGAGDGDQSVPPTAGAINSDAPDAPDPLDNGIDAQAPGNGRPSTPFDVTTADDPPDNEAPPAVTADSGPQDARPIGDGDAPDIAALVGLWDYSRDHDDGRDVVLFDIASDGAITEYDFQADDLGSGVACYEVRSASLASRGNDRYDIQDTSTLPGSDSIDDLLITVDGDTITFRYIGSAFDPEFGDGMAGITERYPRASGVTLDQLSPCDDG